MKDFETVYKEYADMLYRIALTELQNCHDASDAVQDVFLRYIHTSPRFHDDDHERAWFIRVTVNRCKDMLKHRSLRNHLSIDDLAESLPYEDKSIIAGFDATMECLEQIPEKYRIVIVLHYLEGFSVEEIAGMLKKSKSAVKMRLMRGRESIRSRLEDGNV